MTLTDDLTAASHHLARILPAIPTWQTRTREHRRGGLPTGQNYTGTRSTRTNPIPTLDAEDRRLDTEQAMITDLALKARQALENLERVMYARILPAKMLDDPAPRVCDNPHCAREVGDPHGPDLRRYAGSYRLCGRCYQHYYRHDAILWPRKKNGDLVAGWVRRGDLIVRVELEDAR